MACFCMSFLDVPQSHWFRPKTNTMDGIVYHQDHAVFLWSKCLATILMGVRQVPGKSIGRSAGSPLAVLRGLDVNSPILCNILGFAGFPYRLPCHCCKDETTPQPSIIVMSSLGKQACVEVIYKVEDSIVLPVDPNLLFGGAGFSCRTKIRYSFTLSKEETKDGLSQLESLGLMGTCDAGVAGVGSGTALLKYTKSGLSYEHTSLSRQELQEYEVTLVENRKKTQTLVLTKKKVYPGYRSCSGPHHSYQIPCKLTEHTTIRFQTVLAFEFYELIQ